LNSVKEVLAPLGFRRKGSTFFVRHDDVLLMVNLQKSTSSTSAKVIATLNLGVFSYPLAQALEELEYLESRISIWLCHWQERIGAVMPEHYDKWWAVSSLEEAVQAGKEMVEALQNYGLPALEKVDSTAKLHALWESVVNHQVRPILYELNIFPH
jgi:hypothetical protein